METKDLLNIFLTIGIIAITICIVFVSFFFIQALKSITQLMDNLDETTDSIKEKIKLKALAAVPGILLALASKIIKKRRR